MYAEGWQTRPFLSIISYDKGKFWKAGISMSPFFKASVLSVLN